MVDDGYLPSSSVTPTSCTLTVLNSNTFSSACGSWTGSGSSSGSAKKAPINQIRKENYKWESQVNLLHLNIQSYILAKSLSGKLAVVNAKYNKRAGWMHSNWKLSAIVHGKCKTYATIIKNSKTKKSMWVY